MMLNDQTEYWILPQHCLVHLYYY